MGHEANSLLDQEMVISWPQITVFLFSEDFLIRQNKLEIHCKSSVAFIAHPPIQKVSIDQPRVSADVTVSRKDKALTQLHQLATQKK